MLFVIVLNAVLVVKPIAYVTHYPCIICYKASLASGIKEIKYLEDYKNDELVEHFCNQLNVKLIKL